MLPEPLLDDSAPWKRRFRAPRIAWTKLAKAAPTRGLACGNQSGIYQLYAWDVPTGEMRQLTHKPTGMPAGEISPDGRYVYYLEDERGNEIGHYARIPFEGGEPEDVTPNMPPYSSWHLEVSEGGNTLGFVAATPHGFDLYVEDLGDDHSIGDPRLLIEMKGITFGPHLSHNGEIAVIETTERAVMQFYNLVAIDTKSGERIGELWDGDGTSVEAVAFSPVQGDMRFLARTNRTGVRRPVIWNLLTNERTDIELGDLQGDVLPFDWSLDAERILLCQFDQARQQLYVYHISSGQLARLDHPGGTYVIATGVGTYFGPGGDLYSQWQDSTQPSRLIVLDGETGAVKGTLLSAGDVPPGRKWESISYTASHGQEIQGWLALPEGEGPFPTILDTHGGPESVQTESFMASAQAWLDHGFAFLTINYTGSVTFGREFQQRIWGNPGNWEVQDMVAARDWLVEHGIARPDAIFLTGGSYGGYLTLLALGQQPDLWAGGMAVVAIADWTTLYEDSADAIRGYEKALFGGAPDEMPEQYAASSPITYVRDVTAPLLVIQGRNDTRCPHRQMEMYIETMQALGKPVEVHWFEAGHGSYDVEQQVKHQEIMLRFAYRVLEEQSQSKADDVVEAISS